MIPVILVGLVATLFPGLVSAEKNIKFINHCPYDIYSWTVGPAKSGWTGHDHEAVIIPANTVTYQGMVNGEKAGGGISMKLRDLPNYEVAPAGIIQVEYNLVPSQNHLWYDMSAIDCNYNVGPEHPSFCPLIRSGMKVYVEHADQGKCPLAHCTTDGKCYNTYKEHGHWQGEPTFRCDAGKDIVVEFCTERAGPKTFNGCNEPGHHEPQPDKKPGNPTTNGACGAKTPGGETCFGYAHGNCCSQYGWCGFSEAHCGTGCQSGFGNCFCESAAKPSSYQPPAQSSSYSPPSEPSSVHSSYSKSTPSYYPPVSTVPIYYRPPSSYHQPSTTHTPRYSHIEHTWSSYGKPSSSYAKPSTLKSTPAYSKPTSSYDKPTSSYHAPSSSYTPPVKPSHSSVYSPAASHSKSTPVYSKPGSSDATPSHSKSTPVYSKLSSSYPTPSHSKSKYTPTYSAPTRSKYTPTYSVPVHSKSTSIYNKPSSSYATPTHTKSKYTPTYSAPKKSTSTAYTPPAHTPSYSPPYSPPRYRTIYATHTITETRPHVIKTVTVSVSGQYHATGSSSGYRTPSSYSAPTSSTAVYNKPSHTPQQEPHIPSSWYNKPSTSSSVYSVPTTSSAYNAPTPKYTEPIYYPPPPRA